jgi:hypothetical protein
MPLREATIATIGSGVMAESMIAGLLRAEQVEPSQIYASHPRADRRDELVKSYGINAVEDNAAAVSQGADVVVLAIKPQMLVRVSGARSRRRCATASWSSASSPAPARAPWPTCCATARSRAACPTRRPSSAAA